MKITLPFPPSVNNAFPTSRSGKRFPSPRYKAFKENAAIWLLTQRKRVLQGDLKVEMKLFRPQKRGDIDNYSKCIFDVLKGVCFEDDSQIAELHISRFDDKDNPRVELEITERN